MINNQEYDDFLRNRYGNDIVDQLHKTIEIYAKSESFVDNYRLAETNDAEALLHYEEVRSSGCCGYFDDYTCIEDGSKYRTFRIGYNYGH